MKIFRTIPCGLISGYLLLCECPATPDETAAANAIEAPDTGAEPTLSQLAKPAKRSPGAPKYEDIVVSPRQFDWPKSQGRDVLQDIKTFHATRLDWMYVYEGDEEILNKVRDMGLTVGLALTSPRDSPAPVRGPMGFGARPDLYTRGRILDIEGKQLDGRSSMHDPDTDELHKEWLRFLSQFKPVSIQRDEPDWNYRNWDFNPHALGQFNAYLATRVPKATLDELQIENPETFDLKAYIRAHHEGKSVPRALKTLWEEFRLETLLAYYEKLRHWTKEIVGRDVDWSANYSSFVSFGPAELWSDFAISEVQPSGGQFGIGNPWSIHKKLTIARELGKAVVFTLGSHDVRENKVMIGLTYAMGAHMLCPYGVYMKNKPRLYDDPAIYSDVYDFVNRWGKTYLAGYEEVFALGNGIAPPESDLPAPIHLRDPSASVYAFVRARPGQADAPVVIHLVNWGRTAAEPLAVTLEPQRFFPGRGLKISLLRPGADPEVLSDGLQARVDVPVPDPWSILVVEPASDSAEAPWAPEVTAEAPEFFDSRSVELHSRTPGAAIHYTLDGTTPAESSPRYEGPISIASDTRLQARAFLNGAESPVSGFDFKKVPRNSLLEPGQALEKGLIYQVRTGIKIGVEADLDNPMMWAGGSYEFTDSEKGTIETLSLPPTVPRSGLFSVLFNGLIDVPRDGVYTFYVTVDDECRLSIDGKVLINQTGRKVPPDLGMTEHSASLLLSQGWHRIDMEFVQMYHEFGLEVEWAGPGLPRQPIAAENLKH